MAGGHAKVVERLVQLIIQALLDLGLMMMSALGSRRAEGYSEVGLILKELGVVDESGVEAPRSMAGLRSLLVHAYAAVDRGSVMEFSRSLQLDAPRLAYIMLKRAGEAGLDPEGSVEEGLRGVVEALSKVFKGRVRAAYLYGGGVKGYSLKGTTTWPC